MIELTKMDGSRILLNLENIKYLEEVPDTLVLFLNGDSLMIQESIEEVGERIIHRQAQILKAVGS